ncbi:hypothetical protein [Actinomadura geliboluensis]
MVDVEHRPDHCLQALPMLARMEAMMMDRMQAMIDPPLARQIAAESSTARRDLHLVTDTLTAMQIPTGN